MAEALDGKLKDLPDTPGVYLLKDVRGRVIYIGKAKSLRKRVASYFASRADQLERTRALVAEIRDLDWLVTASEIEALALESSLVKKNKPRYNVKLRDDKNFPYVRLTTSEDVPRMDVVRRPRRDGDAYFGPFIPAATARKTLRLLGQHFGIRSCKGPIEEKDHRACLYYHVDQCLAPCAGLVSREDYAGAVRDATLFLRGHDAPLRAQLEERMAAASAREDYERAAHHRDLIRMLEKRREPQRVASTGLEDQDAWGLHREGGRAFLVVAFVREGTLRGRREFALPDVGDTPDDSMLGDAVRLYYHDAGYVPREVLLPAPIDDADLTAEWLRGVADRAVSLHVPQRGDRADRVRFATQAARTSFELKFARGEGARAALDELTDALDLAGPAERIECFDVSNVQGSDVVASMVVFVGGEPARRDYRTFGIRDVAGAPDDFKAMREVVSRRYRRLVAEGRELPDLVVVDGGLGQLHAAEAVLRELELHDMPLVSLAKQEELIFRPGGSEPLRLPRTSAALQLVQRLRDEAHRVAITFHRKRRRARTFGSVLDAVPGVGEARRRRLLREFGSLEGIRAASPDALAAVVGKKLARTLHLHLGPERAAQS